MSTGKVIFGGVLVVGIIVVLNRSPQSLSWVTSRVNGFTSQILPGTGSGGSTLSSNIKVA